MVEPTRGRFIGVHRRPSPPARFPWYARIMLPSGRAATVSSFETDHQAAEEYDRAALYYFGKAAPRNFPGKILPPADEATLRLEIQRRAKVNTSSEYRGVHRKRDRWLAAISVADGPVFLGHWKTERQAAEAYDRAVLFSGREKSNLNFPKRRLAPTSPAELRRLAHAEFKKRTSSRYRGVRFEPKCSRRPWVATLVGIGPTNVLRLGIWEAEEDAARAYDRAALHYLGSAARLNFPGEKLDPADAEMLRREARREAKRAQTSQYIGVSWNKQGALWQAVISHEGRRMHLGFYKNERAAAEAYDDKCAEFRGPAARLNFDPETGKRIWGMRLDVTSPSSRVAGSVEPDVKSATHVKEEARGQRSEKGRARRAAPPARPRDVQDRS
jgi:hypothetical protein